MSIARAVFKGLLGKRLPRTSGELVIGGLNAPVLIRRDEYGIVYIEAENDRDAWYALGFCQGQDRTFQLEGLVRVIRGTLAELLGPDGLPVDRLSRRIGFAHSAQEQLAVMDAEVRQMAEDFARGINDGAQKGLRRKPHEFTLLRAEPTPWTAADVMGMLKLISFLLASNWDSELVRLKILLADGPEALAILDPDYPDWLPLTIPPGEAAGRVVDRLAADLQLMTAVTGQGGGSNNWAIAPGKTASGRPILANDPHLAASLPPHWYLAHARAPDWAAGGATFVGAPGFPVGFNGRCAWGVTAGFTDNTDLYVEEVDGDGRVRQGDEWVECPVRVEVIRVKGGQPVEERVLETPRGPIIGPAFAGEVGAISMQATWLAVKPVRGFLMLHKARNFEEFRQNFADWPGLPLNMAYADAEGNIGWQLVGEAPRRKQGWGTIPLPGADPANGWHEESVPFAEMPYALNPDAGFVATANNKPISDDAGPYLGADWVDGYRLARIAESLAARGDWTLADAMALQMDQVSIPWREIRELALAVPAAGDAQQAVELLAAWDGVVSADSAAAAVYELFMAEMSCRIVRAKAPQTADWALGAGFTPLIPHSILVIRRTGHLVRLLREQPDGWFGRSWEMEMADALATAVSTLKSKFGSEPAQWGWGQVRQLTLAHPVGEQKPMDKIFNLGPFPWGGDAATVAQASVPPLDPIASPPFIASMRMVVDVGNWDENWFVLPGGQSGNPASPHYDDMLSLWQAGQGVRLAWSPEKVALAAREILKLLPANNLRN